MEQLRCIATIANLEGFQDIDLPTSATDATALPHLDQRVNRLEAVMNITPPAPVAEPSWGSLVWRLWRLSSKVAQQPALRRHASAAKPGVQQNLLSAEDQANIKLDVVKDTIDRCTAQYQYPAWQKCVTDTEDFSLVLQRLAHVQGKRRKVLEQIPTTIVGIYAAAAELSFECELGPSPYSVPPPGRWPASQPRHNTAGTKPCCGCCSCFCHNKTILRHMPPGWGPLHARKERFSWLKKLFFWRRRNTDRDDSSSSSGTLAD